jgi:hypothetical protein
MINASRFRQADYLRNVWQATAEYGMAPADLLEPATWSNVAADLKPYDRIEVAADDGSWWAEYLVVASDKLWAKVVTLRAVELVAGAAAATAPSELAQYDVILRGVKKWSVVRKDGHSLTVIRDGFAKKEEAEVHLDALLKAVSANPVAA